MAQYISYFVVGIATLALVWWIFRDARIHARRLRQERRDLPKPPQDGDMSEAAGLPPRPPWMG